MLGDEPDKSQQGITHSARSQYRRMTPGAGCRIGAAAWAYLVTTGVLASSSAINFESNCR